MFLKIILLHLIVIFYHMDDYDVIFKLNDFKNVCGLVLSWKICNLQYNEGYLYINMEPYITMEINKYVL